MIRVFNTLSRSKEEFRPVESGKVGIYLCGPTVYKPSHIGHMVGPVIFDTIKRYLTYSGFNVKWVVNITDVDDKLITESNYRGIPMSDVASEMIDDYKQNLSAMGVDSIDEFPKATEYIGEIIQFTQDLIDKGFAYESEGDVYFEVEKFKEYGKLSNRTLEQMAGEGGSAADRKRSTFDFALWKSAKAGEPSWESPWGNGRPGWHIECSVMSCALLGETFDIHGGGLDLQFPHHENEVAQSESRHGKPMAKYWLHNGLMQASSEVGKVGGRKTHSANDSEIMAKEGDIVSQEAGKISKSKGASPFRDLLAKIPAETIRFFLVSSHYRRPIDFSEERIFDVARGLETFYRFFKRFEFVSGETFYSLNAPQTRSEGDQFIESELLKKAGDFGDQIKMFRNKFLDSMDDDFNTGGAIGILFEMLRGLNKFIETNKLEGSDSKNAVVQEKISQLKEASQVLKELVLTLGLFRKPLAESSQSNDGNNVLIGQLVQILIELRLTAKKNKDFAAADKIRDDLKSLGITLEDRPGGTAWNRD
ncbi:MAG: cysteine--tRNA ligase [Planctomycetia bacterium]|nr:cysteine--tRNA ligase [Planctomycetia bacterium]